MRTLQQIKTDISNRINSSTENPINLIEAIEMIKSSVEDVVKFSGSDGKKSLITSQQLINLLHEVVKKSLVDIGNVNPQLIKPPIGQSKGEIKLFGFLKDKKQDVCVFPNNKYPVEEAINFDGLFNTGVKEPYGELFSEHILSINLRSQLSSLSANIDTMFERTYAEPLNLHRRLPKMVLGEVYLLSLRELNKKKVAQNEVEYLPITNSVKKYLERYIKGFSALNMREGQADDLFKYERVALVIVDFSKSPIKIYNNTAELIEDNLLPENSDASMEDLSFNGFTERLIQVYERRFGTGILS